MKKIREDDFNFVNYMLVNGKDVSTIMKATGLSAASIDRIISAGGDFATFDEQRKERSAKIIRKAKEKEGLPEQIGIDDVMPPVDPLIMVRDAINKNTEVVETLMKQLCEILRGA